MGFSTSGLPLALQIAGRPFDDASVLRIAHAYEQATAWHTKRPPVVIGATPAPLPPKPDPVSDLGADARAAVAQACKRAGLTLTDRQFEMVCVAAPYVEKLTARLRHPRGFDEEPANIFQA
jgi:aspartyl-tRNA(Asn)/glutamyl-tRNA(Gln) amidotransferase subunit A